MRHVMQDSDVEEGEIQGHDQVVLCCGRGERSPDALDRAVTGRSIRECSAPYDFDDRGDLSEKGLHVFE